MNHSALPYYIPAYQIGVAPLLPYRLIVLPDIYYVYLELTSIAPAQVVNIRLLRATRLQIFIHPSLDLYNKDFPRVTKLYVLFPRWEDASWEDVHSRKNINHNNNEIFCPVVAVVWALDYCSWSYFVYIFAIIHFGVRQTKTVMVVQSFLG